MTTTPIILASRSPRRRELLSQLVDPSRIHVVPPENSDEPGFEDCQSINDVDRRIREIARTKRNAVRHELRILAELNPDRSYPASGGRGSRRAASGEQVSVQTGLPPATKETSQSANSASKAGVVSVDISLSSPAAAQEDLRPPEVCKFLDISGAAILAADTTIVAESAAGRMEVLGQPPPEDASRPTVRRWFEEFYFARPHLALTAVSIERSDGRVAECVAVTTVGFSRARADWLDWYLATNEPNGKAGGYAIQGLASVFIDRIEGSLSNVVGLPLAETRQLLLDLGLA